ncbi:MAG: hypothetical protein M0R40_06195 [Firmicutes bacterium]|nr:hypothetical protein [Bacillota bacterium]
MKKLIYAIIAALLCEITVLAGSIPEDLLSYDESLVFFGEVTSNSTNEGITVMPTQKIKGDVEIGESLSYDEYCPFGNFPMEKGKAYLFGYYNENNPLYVFNISSTDVKTLKILNKTGGGQEERMQDYLNNGDFEQKEVERLSKANAQIPTPSTAPATQGLPKSRNYYLYGVVGIFLILFYVWLFNKKKQ